MSAQGSSGTPAVARPGLKGRLLNASIAAKMVAVLVSVAALFAGVLLLVYLPAFERELLSDRKESLKNLVEVAHSLLGEYQQRVESGELSLEEAQQRAIGRIGNFRYGRNDYFWINDTTMPFPWMIMHPIIAGLKGGELDQERFKTASKMQYGVNGRIKTIPGADYNILQAFVEVVHESGDGFVAYSWPKPVPGGTEAYYPKESYVKLFEPWGWVVGTGGYVDDIQARLSRLRWSIIWTSVAILGAAILLLATFLAAFVTRPIGALMRYAETISQGQFHAGVDGRFYGETARLKEVITQMVGDLEAAIRRAEANETEARQETAKAVFLSEKLDALFRSMTEVVALHEIVFGEDGRVANYRTIECNRAFEEAFGIRKEDVAGRLATDYLGAKVAPHLEVFERVARGGNPSSFEEYDEAAGRHYIVSVASPRENEFVTIATDITERKQAEEALRHVRQYLANIIDSMPSVLVGVDADGHVTQWNVRAQRCTGLSAEEAVGRPLETAFPRLAAEMVHVRQAMASRTTQTQARRSSKEAGEIRFEDITIYPLIANGAKGAVIRVDDVTEHVRIEEMMLQSEKMLSVGGLAAGMAHEINNPLGGMIQTASVMAERLSNPDLPANRQAAETAGTTMGAIAAFMQMRGIFRMLENIQTSGKRAVEIVSNMLGFARNDESVSQPHDLAELLDRCIDLAGSDYDLKKKYDFRKIEVVRQYEAGVPPVPCQSGKIQQVLLNILRNGAEAMQEEGRSDLKEGKKPRLTLRLAQEREDRRVRIEIEDNGPGMDAATRRRVFEPFFTTKPTDRGTGLGLSVSYFIVTENHGGEMRVESEPGKGAKFTVWLPLERKEI